MEIRNWIGSFAALCLLSAPVMADGLTGNRYDGERLYHSEITASASYIALLNHLWPSGNHHQPMVILDVRSIDEYLGGHPPHAYSLPYPHIYNRRKEPEKGEYIAQNDEDFVQAVHAMNLPKDALIVTMCRTGSRSIAAGNLLAEAGYTNVRNMWEGFVGRLKQNTSGDDLDLDNDGEIDPDPYSMDLDGWANAAGLPVEMKIDSHRIYAPYADLYYTTKGER